MTVSEKVAYHLRELKVTQDPSHAAHILPDITEDDRAILDIGCGVGQTMVGMELGEERLLVGVDIDHDPLAYGHKTYGNILYSKCTAEALPLTDETFDLVFARVAVPYTNVPYTAREMFRVLKPGGRIWITLHPVQMTGRQLMQSVKQFKLKDIVFRTYVLLNGLSLHLFGKLFPFPTNGQYESCQSNKAIKSLLVNAGFENVTIDRQRHFLVTAHKPRQSH